MASSHLASWDALSRVPSPLDVERLCARVWILMRRTRQLIAVCATQLLGKFDICAPQRTLSLGWTADATLHGCQQADAAGQHASRSSTASDGGCGFNRVLPAASPHARWRRSSHGRARSVVQQPAVGSARRMTLEHECACVCQRCIRQQYVSYVRNAHVTSRNYDPTLIPTVGFLTRCT